MSKTKLPLFVLSLGFLLAVVFLVDPALAAKGTAWADGAKDKLNTLREGVLVIAGVLFLLAAMVVGIMAYFGNFRKEAIMNLIGGALLATVIGTSLYELLF